MSDEKFDLDINVKDAVGQLNNVREKIIGLGDSKNLSGLISGFTSLAGPIAIAGAAIFAMKASLDLAKEGEQIERINNQFDEMSKSAGQSSTKLRAGIEASTKGMIDMEDALKSANKVMYDMGPNAAKIPQMFELARKAGKVYGGETTENFEKISQAIVNGNTRMLRDIGLKVDAAEAQKKYAVELGKTVQTMTAMEKQTALLNAVMAKGDEKFKNVSKSGDSIGDMLKQITVSFKEFGDMVALAFGKSDLIKDTVRGWRDAFTGVTEYMKGTFGTELQKSEKHVQDLSDELNKMKSDLMDIENGDQGILGKLFGPNAEELKQRIEIARAELKGSMAQNAKLAEEENAKTLKESKEAQEELAKSGRGGPTPEERAKIAQAESAFQKDLLKLKEQRLSAEMEIETNADKYTEGLNQQQIFVEQETANRISELKLRAAQGDGITASQAAMEIEQIEAEKTAKIQKMQDDLAENQLKVYDNQLKAARDASGGMAAAFAQGSAAAKKHSKDFGDQGVKTFTSVKNNSIAAFKAMGDGSKSASEAMKGFLLNSVADYVEMKGQAMLLEGMWPPNPVAIAAGGGMIALSAAMRSAAGGSSSGGGAGAGAGGGGGGPGGSSPQDISSKPEPEEQKKKSVTIQVQGNYFETDQTKQKLMEMIRENTDATDFKYQQIGVG